MEMDATSTSTRVSVRPPDITTANLPPEPLRGVRASTRLRGSVRRQVRMRRTPTPRANLRPEPPYSVRASTGPRGSVRRQVRVCRTPALLAQPPSGAAARRACVRAPPRVGLTPGPRARHSTPQRAQRRGWGSRGSVHAHMDPSVHRDSVRGARRATTAAGRRLRRVHPGDMQFDISAQLAGRSGTRGAVSHHAV